MEGQRATVEHESALVDLKHCLTPIADLPTEYREAIDRGHTTGWKSLDYYLQGIRKGEITVITADTGVGKTTFATHLLVNCAMQGIPVWLNSWEMKPEMVMRKVASIALRSPLKICNFTPEQSKSFDEWCSLYKLYVNPVTVGTDVKKLGEDLKKAQKLGVQVVLLDHLDYLVTSRYEKQHEAIEETMKALHEMCFMLGMHFLLICHPRQTGTGNEEIGLHSLKGSSSIKQYADNVLVLHRCSRSDPSSDPSKVKVRIAKNRMFGTEGVSYLFYNAFWDGYEELRG